MKEYIAAKKKLDALFAEAKKNLEAEVRPVLHKTFQQFFIDNPEVEWIKIDLSTQIYDDENYNSGIESVTCKLLDQYTSPQLDKDYYSWRGVKNYCSTSYKMTKSDILPTLVPLFGSVERVEEVSENIDELCEEIQDGSDVEMLQLVFEKDCEIIVTKEGFKVK